jgi:cytosine/adenosine deaminase-related metal-dependent hydrolase/SAM-dependent methyltransferase
MSRRSAACDGRTSEELRRSRAFDAWAHSYDTQQNPLLVLEQRFLERMLPDLSGRDVLDAGCGSGRWLSRISLMGTHRLCGMDASAGMLLIAAQKNLPGVELVKCSCDETPYAGQSFDVILSSFVLSYIRNLESFAVEMSRIARSGCDLFLSDLHPVTQAKLGWKRTFQDGQEAVELDTVCHNIRDVIGVFASFGWKLCAALETEFGSSEREVFEAAGRLGAFYQADQLPAIYLLHLRKPHPQKARIEEQDMIAISGARCAIGPRETAPATLHVCGERITLIAGNAFSISSSPYLKIDLRGYLVMPGFINAHDHLEFALFPRLANPPYANASAWAEDIHERFAEIIAKHRSVPRNARLWWGALRNLLCGVTTVCHHNPSETEFQRADFPIKVVRDFGWEHSLAFGGDLRRAHSATPPGSPFMVHACEGVDDEARQEIAELDRLGVLDRNTVVIHGLAIDDTGLDLMRRCGASLVVCPTSNNVLFGETPDMRIIGGVRQVALGSDSPLTAAGNLLDEVAFAIASCDVPPQLAYSMVTEFPASILTLKEGEGSFRFSGKADLIAVRDADQNAAERIRTLSSADIEFVMIDGRVQLASDEILQRLPKAARKGLQPLCVGGIIRWLRAPIAELMAAAEEVIGPGQVELGGKPVALAVTSEAHHGR